jgi:predicted amidohydrolase
VPPELTLLCRYVSIGFSEIDHATLYLTQTLIDPSGEVINHRRKIKPTHVEKLVYGDGSGDTFKSVTQTELGRLGQLNCWEGQAPTTNINRTSANFLIVRSFNIAVPRKLATASYISLLYSKPPSQTTRLQAYYSC